MNLIPYLTFNGDCEEALNLYKSVFNGEVSSFQRFNEMPPDPNMPVGEDWGKKIMHAEMKFGNDLWLYFSDVWEGSKVESSQSVSVHLDVDSEEDLNTFFTRLAESGTVTMPVQKMFWGAVYGSLTDKFGINWGFNYTIPQ